MEGETIFVQTDLAFHAVNLALTELRDQHRLHVTHSQIASIDDIESNDEQEDHRLRFGGQNAPITARESFSRTASEIVPMCMLEAVGINRDLWPQIGNTVSNARNQDKLQREVFIHPLFSLATDDWTAIHYWLKYCQLYPQFRIRNTVQYLNINGQGSMPSMMLIFRNNATEVIEITTTFNATPSEENHFSSYVSVICQVRNISQGEDGPHTTHLKKLMQTSNIPVPSYSRAD